MNRLLIIALVIAATFAACTGPQAGGMIVVAAVVFAILTGAAFVAQLTGCDDDAADEQRAHARAAEEPATSPASSSAEPPAGEGEGEESEPGAPRLEPPDSLADDDDENDDDSDDDESDDDEVDDADSSDTTYDFDDDMTVCLSIIPYPDEGSAQPIDDDPSEMGPCLSVMHPELHPDEVDDPLSPEGIDDILLDGGSELRRRDEADDRHSGDETSTASADRRDILDRMNDRLPDDVLARLDDDQ